MLESNEESLKSKVGCCIGVNTDHAAKHTYDVEIDVAVLKYALVFFGLVSADELLKHHIPVVNAPSSSVL